MHTHSRKERVFATIVRFFLPQYGWCLCCKVPWRIVHGHSTKYDATSGCFPLCINCFNLLDTGHPIETLNARMPFYIQLTDGWRLSPLNPKAQLIYQAVYREAGVPWPVQDHEWYVVSTGDQDMDEAIKKWQEKMS
jgi:hypothetical protein